MKRPLYFGHESFLEHDPGEGMPAHPEAPVRLLALEQALAERDWLGFERREAPPASERDLELVHGGAHVASIRDLARCGGGAVDADTYVGERSYRAALHAAGASCEAVRALRAGEADLAFAAVRPPGHHAEPDRAMGFCLFNNVAVAAALAIAQLGARRVFVLDWDVHHGNGTAEAFRHRSDVLYASIHQSPLYPGTGRLEDAGTGEGEGYTINLPVPAGSEEDLWLALLERAVMPAARAFAPDLVLISAGFDAHRDDPLASVRLRTESFAEMASHVRALAQDVGAPVGVVLEGGYAPSALAASAIAMLEALAGDRGPGPGARQAAEPADDSPLVSGAVAQVARYWPAMTP